MILNCVVEIPQIFVCGIFILNLPSEIIGVNGSISYIYSAGGEKLGMRGNDGSLTLYRSVFTYARSAGGAEQLLHIAHPEGIVSREGNGWSWKYFKHDHVGSVRAVLAYHGGKLVEEQRADFYPSGYAWEGPNELHVNRYLYGGKEYQDGLNLGWYDFHARYYNPFLGRWMTQDPRLQTTNPYLYAGNSPMMYVDPDGELFGFVAGFFKGLFTGENPFKEAWKVGINEYKIYAGMFTADKSKSFWGKLWEITSRFTWQTFQTTVGRVYATVSNWAGQVDKVDYWGGATVSSGNNWGSGGAITMSSFITGSRSLKADPYNKLFQHEYGHYLQSQSKGPLHIVTDALPSLMSAMNNSAYDHARTSMEQDANKRALRYFEKRYPGFGEKGWNYRANPIIADPSDFLAINLSQHYIEIPVFYKGYNSVDIPNIGLTNYKESHNRKYYNKILHNRKRNKMSY